VADTLGTPWRYAGVRLRAIQSVTPVDCVKPRRTVIALTSDHLEAVHAAIRQWQQPIPGRPGPRHTGDLADVVDLMLATGARIGEVIALRWQDLDLVADRPTLTICGTIVYVKGKGFFRQEWWPRTRSRGSWRPAGCCPR
jgi:integrase